MWISCPLRSPSDRWLPGDRSESLVGKSWLGVGGPDSPQERCRGPGAAGRWVACTPGDLWDEGSMRTSWRSEIGWPHAIEDLEKVRREWGMTWWSPCGHCTGPWVMGSSAQRSRIQGPCCGIVARQASRMTSSGSKKAPVREEVAFNVHLPARKAEAVGHGGTSLSLLTPSSCLSPHATPWGTSCHLPEVWEGNREVSPWTCLIISELGDFASKPAEGSQDLTVFSSRNRGNVLLHIKGEVKDKNKVAFKLYHKWCLLIVQVTPLHWKCHVNLSDCSIHPLPLPLTGLTTPIAVGLGLGVRTKNLHF